MHISFYVVCLKSFQAHINHGQWISADFGIDEIQEQINDMLAKSSFEKATKWRIHKYETRYKFDFLNSGTDIKQLHEMEMFIEEYGDRAAKLLEYFEGDVNESRDTLGRYLGKFDNAVAFTKEYFSYFYKLSEMIEPCIDFNQLWERLRVRHYFALTAKEGGVYIFSKGSERWF